MSVQTPIARVEGLGAAHSGTGHFWRQRVSAVALIPLSVWFACVALACVGAPWKVATGVLAQPINAIAMALFVLAALQHMTLGLQVVIEDYVHGEGPKVALVLFTQFFAWIVGAACLFALIRIVL
jgi:succinate dehydrogenase / fumarate reductase, membrane anchor subunit